MTTTYTGPTPYDAPLLEALLHCQRLFAEALSKFNWGASALDAAAIRLLNEIPVQVNNAILQAQGRE